MRSFDCSLQPDFAICVDATASMGDFLSSLKKVMPRFDEIVNSEIDSLNLAVGKMRVRFIFFRDFGYDEEPLIESRFFTLPEDKEEMIAFLDSVTAKGGGDRPESVFEALVTARGSEWRTDFGVRQIIMLFTDADAHPLGAHASRPGYPDGMPTSGEEFRELWNIRDDRGFIPNKSRHMIVCPGDSSVWGYLDDWFYPGLLLPHSPAGMTAEDIEDMICAMLNSGI